MRLNGNIRPHLLPLKIFHCMSELDWIAVVQCTETEQLCGKNPGDCTGQDKYCRRKNDFPDCYASHRNTDKHGVTGGKGDKRSNLHQKTVTFRQAKHSNQERSNINHRDRRGAFADILGLRDHGSQGSEYKGIKQIA